MSIHDNWQRVIGLSVFHANSIAMRFFSETMALARLNTPWRDADEEKDMHVSDGSYLCGRTSSSSSPVSSRTAMATARLGG
jgi:hypothetical protein